MTENQLGDFKLAAVYQKARPITAKKKHSGQRSQSPNANTLVRFPRYQRYNLASNCCSFSRAEYSF
jgi:hypothetical protein